jgi:molybdenum cofactor biosynthesis enzyme MoaA
MRHIVDLGARCNNRCLHCALGDLRSLEGPPVDDRVLAELDAGRAEGARSVIFVGGEPTIHDGLPRWIARARAVGYAVVIVQTNARRMSYAAYARAIAAAGAMELDVALYGAASAAHDFQTSVDGSFDQTTSGVRNARAAGMRVGVTALATRSGWRELPEIAALAARLGADRLHIVMTRPRGAAAEAFDRVVPRLGLVGETVAEAVRVARAAGIVVGVEGFPACVLHDAADARAPKHVDVVVDGVFAPPCDSCAARATCDGVDPQYAERVDLRELRPLRTPPPAPRPELAAAMLRFSGTRLAPATPAPPRAAAVDRSLVQLRTIDGATTMPGKDELRGPAKRKTGRDLETIFPDLFKDPA